MTAMRLKRYPSPSGGIALGKMGVGATMMRDSILPAGARWVEYLESIGDQYIDTGYKFVFGDTIRAAFAPTSTVSSTTVYFFGADTTYNIGLNSHYDPSYQADGVRGVYGEASGHCEMLPVVAYSPGTIYACEFTPSIRKINNGQDTKAVKNPGTASYTVVLFAARRGSTIRLVSTGFAVTERFFNFSVERNGVKTLDLRPIAIGTTGYMLDLVTGDYLQYGNKGTGDFVIGPDTNAPAI